MAQTTLTGNITFPDGAKVQIKESGGAYEDIGALGSAINLSIDYDEQVYEPANAEKTAKRIRNMTVGGTFTLVNLDLDKISLFGGGLFTKVVTAGSTVVDADITDQSMVTYVAGVPQALSPIITSTGVVLRFSAPPVITSITASISNVLAANDDYIILADAESTSGYSIIYNGSGTATVATSETMIIDYGDNVPVAKTELNAGSLAQTLTAYSLKFTHTDTASLTREVEIYSVNSNSGSFQFNFKGSNEDGVEEMPMSFTGEVDTSLTDGYQLIRIARDTGAV